LSSTKWSRPLEVSDLEMAFPAQIRDRLMPPYESIPEEFRRGDGYWMRWQNRWFCSGLPSWPKGKEGIDAQLAFRHLHCIQSSYEPKHEHKMAAVAYLASLWLIQEEET